MNPQTFALDLYWYNPPRKNPASLEGASVGQQDMVPPPSSSSLTKRWPPHHWIQKTLGWKKSKLFKVLEKLWSMHNPCFHKYYCLEVGYSMYLSFIKGVGSKKNSAVLRRVQLFATPWTIACLSSPSVHGILQNMGCHFLLQGIFQTQGWNPCLLHWQVDSLPLSHQGNPQKELLCNKSLDHTLLW